jgi:hypothetical protein
MRDVLVIQTCQHPGLALESLEPLRVFRELGGEDLERDLAAELAVLGSPNLAHPTRAELAGNPIVSEGRADH